MSRDGSPDPKKTQHFTSPRIVKTPSTRIHRPRENHEHISLDSKDLRQKLLGPRLTFDLRRKSGCESPGLRVYLNRNSSGRGTLQRFIEIEKSKRVMEDSVRKAERLKRVRKAGHRVVSVDDVEEENQREGDEIEEVAHTGLSERGTHACYRNTADEIISDSDEIPGGNQLLEDSPYSEDNDDLTGPLFSLSAELTPTRDAENIRVSPTQMVRDPTEDELPIDIEQSRAVKGLFNASGSSRHSHSPDDHPCSPFPAATHSPQPKKKEKVVTRRVDFTRFLDIEASQSSDASADEDEGLSQISGLFATQEDETGDAFSLAALHAEWEDEDDERALKRLFRRRSVSDTDSNHNDDVDDGLEMKEKTLRPKLLVKPIGWRNRENAHANKQKGVSKMEAPTKSPQKGRRRSHSAPPERQKLKKVIEPVVPVYTGRKNRRSSFDSPPATFVSCRSIPLLTGPGCFSGNQKTPWMIAPLGKNQITMPGKPIVLSNARL